MRKYYTRPCNFYYGNYAKNLIKNKKALPLAGNNNISFDQLEILQRQKGKIAKSYIYSINEIKKLNGEIKDTVRVDLKNITSKRKTICNLKFDTPLIMGVLNITPDSFSDGGLFFDEIKAYKQGESMINLFEKASESGLDITYDMYPYTAAGAGLNQTIPLWAQAGTMDKYMSRLKNPSTRKKIRDEVAAGIGGISPLWDTWKIAYINNESNKHLLGLSVEEIAKERNVEPAEAVLQLVEEEKGSVPTRVHNRVEGDVRYFMSHKLGMIGSDGRAMSTDGFYKKALPHPRYYGTHPRILGRYVRQKPSVLTLEDAIYKMTGFPSQRLNLSDRGIIEIGKIADLVIFDPETVIDKATFENPHQYATGIPFVIVKGVPIVDNGLHTQARPGKVLRRGQKN